MKIGIKRAILSVSDKTNIIELAKNLTELNIEILSTGGTSKVLREANIKVTEVSDVTKFPEMMNGRVKTLHPLIHAGILGRRDEDAVIAKEHNIQWIDLVVVNLYPFAETIKNPTTTLSNAIENIDIGGPTLIRSAAKNMEWATVIVDPNDYALIIEILRTQNGLDFPMRKQLATKAFAHTAQYDALIQRYLEEVANPREISLHLTKALDLRYGENPHQKAAAYHIKDSTEGVLFAKQIQGKELSYNNLTDADAAFACVCEFLEPACVIVKHANPCGVAVADNIYAAFTHAFNADQQSAFGGIVALNQTCTKEVAEALLPIFIEVLIAPSYAEDALAILKNKTNCRVLEWQIPAKTNLEKEFKFIKGGVLIQDRDCAKIEDHDLKIVSKITPTEAQIASMLFAWKVVKHIKSNAILIAKNKTTKGVGAGQVSRIAAVDIALSKAGADLNDAVLASDAFFPFRDSIDRIAQKGVTAIIQPGGSVRDDEVIAACNENNIAMVFTGKRCFKH